MKEIKATVLPQIYITNSSNLNDLHLDSQFVDDVDFYSTNWSHLHQLEGKLPTQCGRYNLNINTAKTERYILTKDNETTTIEPSINTDLHQLNYITVKKLGSYTSSTADLQHRIQSMTIAFKNLNNFWFRPYKMTIKQRMRLYNIYIIPIIRYNLGSIAYSQTQLDKLDSHHRKQLRQVLRIFYPVKIHNKQLYNMMNSSPVTILAMEQRWKLFGHILRLNPNTPEQTIMAQYYTETHHQKRGRPPLTLPAILNNDLKLIHTNLVDKF